ncbi:MULTISPECIES: hypothetical protein [unclassified Streptomyces]|uniref:hypothetical protein n=1 Tax=unclassified Streptomyces TaxID=2593676 RepID=UPI002E81C8CD|nr:hypothetical protein [Streptomyces sp. NBC_00589]WTI34603.1 hypothetical protein OIC96_06165 [Streptomyces sp. NBC_00775]WUB31725.1 hypothetical protein OHA51_43565 [Streptomyces sp. NBC_00589]
MRNRRAYARRILGRYLYGPFLPHRGRATAPRPGQEARRHSHALIVDALGVTPDVRPATAA